MIAWLKLVPAWLWKVLGVIVVVLILFGSGLYVGADTVQTKWDAAENIRKGAEEALVDQRKKDIDAKKKRDDAERKSIQEKHDEEMAGVNARLRSSERMRLGDAWCDGAGPITSTESPGSSTAPDPTSRVLPPEVDRAVRALIQETEEVAATGRAAQQTLRNNNLDK